MHSNLIQSIFGRAATTYANSAFIARLSGEHLITQLSCLKQAPSSLLDVGCGPGQFTRQLQRLFPQSQVIGLDLTYLMLNQAIQGFKPFWKKSSSFLQGNAQALPLTSASIQTLFSNSVLHWCPKPLLALQEFYRVLQPEGCLFLATLGPATFQELRETWHTLSPYAHLNEFNSIQTLGEQLMQAGFSDVVLSRDLITVHYHSLKQFFNDMRQSGTRNLHVNRIKGLMTPRFLNNLISAFNQYKTEQGYAITLELVYAHGWKKTPYLTKVSSQIPLL